MPDLTPRASDADRDQYADLLREQTTQGRLSISQFTDRVDAAYTASTLAELDRLVADLPVATPASSAAGQASPTTWHATLAKCVCTVPLHCAALALVMVLALIL